MTNEQTATTTTHENMNYLITCKQCSDFPKICGTEWAAEYVVRKHDVNHDITWEELPDDHNWVRESTSSDSVGVCEMMRQWLDSVLD